MTQRSSWIVSVVCAALCATANALPLQSRGGPTPRAVPRTATAMLGVADWGANYGSQSSLLKGANDSLALGVQNVMVALGPNYGTVDYPGTHFNAPIRNLKDEASNPAFRTVFAMPFQTIAIDASPITVPDFLNPKDPNGEYKALYAEYYNLISYLMQTYRGTGKTFIVKNWEGDNAFYYANQEASHPSIDTEIQNMRLYLQARHDALVQARKDFASYSGVAVQDAIEINSVNCARNGSTPCMLKDVVPYVESDMISYSSYETINTGVQKGDLTGQINRDLSDIRNVPGVNGRPLMIGEFGFGANALAADGAAEATTTAVSAFLANGVSYAFDWQIKDSGGADTTLGLIDSNGNRTPSWKAVHSLVTTPLKSGAIASRQPMSSTSLSTVRLAPSWAVSAQPTAYVPLSENIPQVSEDLPGASLEDARIMAIRSSAHSARLLRR